MVNANATWCGFKRTPSPCLSRAATVSRIGITMVGISDWSWQASLVCIYKKRKTDKEECVSHLSLVFTHQRTTVLWLEAIQLAWYKLDWQEDFCTLAIFVLLHCGQGCIWCISSKHCCERGIVTPSQSQQPAPLCTSSHQHNDAVLSLTSMQTYQKRAETACSWFPGIVEPTSKKSWSRDTIIMREEKPISLGLYAVQMKDRKLGLGYVPLSFPFITQWIYITLYFFLIWSHFSFCFAAAGFCCDTWLTVTFTFGQETQDFLLCSLSSFSQAPDSATENYW